jgi:hypothetical protein
MQHMGHQDKGQMQYVQLAGEFCITFLLDSLFCRQCLIF